MALSSSTNTWQQSGPVPDSNLLLQESYDEGTKIFVSKLTKDETKRSWITSKHDISQLLNVAKQAKDRYEGKVESKAFEWLSKFSVRVQYYGNIMDTMAQHHPEYVALVWGAMKFCFVGILNQEELVAQLSKALAQIADALPRAALKLVLYPTEMMKNAVAAIYAQVIKFLIRALDWYSEGRLKHMYHAITQPFSLRYKDILDEIQCCSRTIEAIAADAAQAELRDMHILMREVKEIAVKHQALTSSGFLNTNRFLEAIQFSEIMTFVANTPLLPAPETSFSQHLALKRLRRFRKLSALARPQSHSQLQLWGVKDCSSLIIIRGDFATRNVSRDLAVGIIEAVKKTDVPVVWALNSRCSKDDVGEKLGGGRGEEHESELVWKSEPTGIDVLKHLVLQILRLNTTLLNERSGALSLTRYKTATTERQWFDLLGSVISGLPQLYIVIDVELVGLDSGEEVGTWPETFARLFEELVEKNAGSTVKVVLVSYRPRSWNSAEVLGSGKGTVLSLGRKAREIKGARGVRPAISMKPGKTRKGI